MAQPIYIKLNIDQATGLTRSMIISRISQIDAMISSLLTVGLTAVTTGNIAEYEIDTGQTRQQVKYTSVDSITKAVADMQKLRNIFANMLSPKVTRLVDSKNLRFKG